MRLFGADNIAGIMDRLGMDDSIPIEHNLVSRSIENAQKKVESRNFDTRKHVLDYDDVMNQQREVIYGQRHRVLRGENLTETLEEMIGSVIDATVTRFTSEGKYPENWDLEGMLVHGEQLFLPQGAISVEGLLTLGSREAIQEQLTEAAESYWQAREQEFGSSETGADAAQQFERFILLRVVDEKWMEHLDAMDQLRQGIGLRAYGNADPLVEYRLESYNMFQDMISSVQEDVVRLLFKLRLVQEQPARVPAFAGAARHVVESHGDEGTPAQPVKAAKTTGRNDPCPCGSGKKYKRCCGK